MAVKFIEYTGRYPTLCRGVLELEVDGKHYIFGGKRDETGKLVRTYTQESNDEMFWESTGFTSADDDNDLFAVEGPWRVDVSRLPKELCSFSAEIESVLNKNIPHGCCGGCI